jgi:hypothetical protein
MKSIMHKGPESDYHLHSYYACIWVGALLRYLLNRGKLPFTSFYTDEKKRVNFWTGLVTLALFIGGIIAFSILLKS